MTRYTVGEIIRFTTRFGVLGEQSDPDAYLEDGKWLVPTDPDVVRLRLKPHGALEETLIVEELENPAVGTYTADVEATLEMAQTPGLMHYRWESEGAAQGAKEGTFEVTTQFAALAEEVIE